jgi:hypothetical protein
MLDGVLKIFLNHVVESNQCALASFMEQSQSRMYAAYYLQVQQASQDVSNEASEANLSVSDEMLSLAVYLDTLAVFGALLLLEGPPALKASNLDLARRNNARQGIYSAVQGRNRVLTNQSLSLQLDIDKLFSQRVKIYEILPHTANVDAIVNAQLKACIPCKRHSLLGASDRTIVCILGVAEDIT